MKVVVDTNILLSALLRQSFTRALLLHPRLELIMPEFALEEIRRHFPAIAERMGVSPEAAQLTLELLLSNVTTVPMAEYARELPNATDLARAIDPDDAAFVALSLASTSPLWTQDKALLNARGIHTISTQAIAQILRDP